MNIKQRNFLQVWDPVERHTLCRTAAGAVAAYKRMGSDRVVIKAQVLTGGRGKAGGVKLVDNTEDTYQEAKAFWV